ncbi:MAG: hypothetical protein AAFQ07_01625 [Chloroflexota bacterium]
MSVQLIMTWDIRENMEQEYFEFVVSEWVPATSRLGLQPIAAWYTQYRVDESIPLIRAEAVADSKEKLADILSSPDWETIQEDLAEFVENYSHKIVETTGEFKL